MSNLFKVCYKCKIRKHISKFYSKSNMCKVCHNRIAKIHRELEKLVDKDYCEICNNYCEKLELANINDHKYTLNLKDYMILCPSCHFLLDNLLENRNNYK